MTFKEIIAKFTDVQNPYDKFFKIVFSIKLIAKHYLNTFIPKDMQSLLNVETLELDNSSFVNLEFKDFSADLIYYCELGTSKSHTPTTIKNKKRLAKIIFIFVHKSYPPDLPHAQVLQYNLN